MPDNASRVWLITGASSGLGRALSTEALQRGERVVVTARDPGSVADLVEQFPADAVPAALDVTDPGQARAAVDTAVAAFGGVDVIVNNAGFGLFGALEELTDDDLRREFETIVFGALNVTRAALPQLRRQRAGHLVQISSLEGVAPIAAGESAYAGSKFAVEGIAEGLAKDVAHLGIRVTIVEPGPIRTDFAAGAVATPPQSDDYADSVGAALDWFDGLQGRQPNDPHLVARAIIRAVSSPDPPLRLTLGREAVQAIRDKLDDQRRSLDTWEQLSTSTAAGLG